MRIFEIEYRIFASNNNIYSLFKLLLMKKLLLLCLLAIVFGSKPSAAYDYVPLVREGVEWGICL